MSLSNFINTFEGTISIYCEKFENKCTLMNWCNELKPGDWVKKYFDGYSGYKCLIIDVDKDFSNGFTTSHSEEHNSNYTPITFEDFCKQYVSESIVENSIINDNYELI